MDTSPPVKSAPSPIFTNEVMLCRALAAEIRHDSPAFIALLEALVASPVGEVVDVACEAEGNVDIRVTLADGRTVGIEAKLNHEISEEQVAREKAVVDWLVLLVLAKEDASAHLDQVAAVVTWEEVLASFVDSRVTMDDVRSAPSTKVQVERALRELHFAERFPDSWSVRVDRGGAGMPSIVVESPLLPGGRSLRGQIQVFGRGMPAALEDVQLEYHVGIEVRPDSTDFPEDASSTAPEWVGHLMALHDKVLDGHLEDYLVRRNPAQAGRSELAARKVALANTFMADHRWLPVGYSDWALGPKSQLVPLDALPALAARAELLFKAWYKMETAE